MALNMPFAGRATDVALSRAAKRDVPKSLFSQPQRSCRRQARIEITDICVCGLPCGPRGSASLQFGEAVMKIPRRQLLHLAVAAAALPALSRFASAESYP